MTIGVFICVISWVIGLILLLSGIGAWIGGPIMVIAFGIYTIHYGYTNNIWI